MLEGFSNKGMITVAMLFLISEGVRRSGALSAVVSKVLPNKKIPVRRAQLRLFPLIYSISLFINNTPLVVIFAPILNATKVIQHHLKFLIPLSYVVGGMYFNRIFNKFSSSWYMLEAGFGDLQCSS